MTPITPSPQTWTLRLKARKTTVLLHIDPLQTFSSIKEHLYAALKETSLVDPTTRLEIPLPSSPSEIQLGRPIDRTDPSLGFTLAEWEIVGEDEDAEDTGKGKGKAKAKGRKSEVVGAVKDCPKGAGIRDRDVLAFRWRGDGTGWEDEEDEEMEGAGREGDMWSVKLASFEDGYGEENEADLGVKGHFEG
ncbi:hypothetical protein CC80DRAFT_416161 [Byssothecium circinans]|uniref:Uncharacterized protein n=1 Tax=Byssothecium circinans TaxID=147558 RepID=A0A6A5TTN8_9PLEO|nr:hypothetical protein CC80DRAFT_416161 [Byssothecium circinans]